MTNEEFASLGLNPDDPLETQVNGVLLNMADMKGQLDRLIPHLDGEEERTRAVKLRDGLAEALALVAMEDSEHWDDET